MDATKVLIGAGIAYLAYNWFTGMEEVEETTAGSGGSTSDAPAAVDIKSLLQAWAAANGHDRYTFDEWRFGYNTIRGSYGPMWEEVASTQDRGFLMSVDEYIALARTGGTLQGFAGLRGVSGFGDAPVVMGVDRATPSERLDITFRD